jgi:hypothetical protein
MLSPTIEYDVVLTHRLQPCCSHLQTEVSYFTTFRLGITCSLFLLSTIY